MQEERQDPNAKPAGGPPPGDVPPAPPAQPAPDPFDPSKLRLTRDFTLATGAKKLLTTIPARKPTKEPFVRTHPDEGYRLLAGTLELKEDRELYLVSRDLMPELAGEPTVRPRLLITTITRQGALILWPLRVPDSNGKLDDWGTSELEAAEVAKKRWVRIIPNMSAGCNDVYVAPESLPPPEWPEIPFADVLKIAFKGKFIESLDHPVLKKLRGEL